MAIVEQIAKKLNKEFSNDNLALMANVAPVYKKMPLRDLGFDYPLQGGIPLGAMIMIGGPFASGKTTLACSLLKQYMDENPDKTCVYVDIERGLNLEFQASINHLDLSKLVYIAPTSMAAEDILDIIEELQAADNIGMIICDSIPSLIPRAVAESSYEKDMGMRSTPAKLLYPFCAKMCDSLHEKKNVFVFVNQLRMKPIMGSPVPVPSFPGGDAPGYYSSLVLRLSRRTWTKGDNMKVSDSENCDGFRVRFAVHKSRVADVRRGNGFITYRYGKGIDYAYDTIEVALKAGYVERINNSMYGLKNLETGEYYKDSEGKELKIRGEQAVKDYLNNNPEFAKEYVDMLVRYISDPTKDSNKIDLLDKEDLEELKPFDEEEI